MKCPSNHYGNANSDYEILHTYHKLRKLTVPSVGGNVKQMEFSDSVDGSVN